MVDLEVSPPIIAPLWLKTAVVNLFHVFNDLNAKEIASWHAFRV